MSSITITSIVVPIIMMIIWAIQNNKKKRDFFDEDERILDYDDATQTVELMNAPFLEAVWSQVHDLQINGVVFGDYRIDSCILKGDQIMFTTEDARLMANEKSSKHMKAVISRKNDKLLLSSSTLHSNMTSLDRKKEAGTFNLAFCNLIAERKTEEVNFKIKEPTPKAVGNAASIELDTVQSLDEIWEFVNILRIRKIKFEDYRIDKCVLMSDEILFTTEDTRFMKNDETTKRMKCSLKNENGKLMLSTTTYKSDISKQIKLRQTAAFNQVFEKLLKERK
jgi:hypothetical protein